MAEALAELKEWPLGFARSRKGNLWRRLDDTATLTVFPGRYGGYAWVLKEDDAPSPEYSPDAYTTERKAVEAAWWLLRGRYT